MTALVAGALAAAVVAAVGGAALPGTGSDGVVRDGVRHFAIHAYTWGFSPRVLRVARGETVRFTVVSDDIHHGFAINELDVNVPLVPGRPRSSATVTVELADGRYEIHCSAFCGLGHPSMKGTLVVGAPPTPLSARLPWLASVAAAAMAAVAIGARARSRRS